MKLLTNKTAIVYGAAGRIGSAASMAFAREGATVVLTGRRTAPLEFLAIKIEQAGGKAVLAKVDALHEDEVCEHAAEVVERFGSVDISFNAISVHCSTGKPLSELSLYEFEEPALKLIRSNFITATTAAKHITRQGSGTILLLTASDDRCLQNYQGGFLAAYKGLEAFSKQLAQEVEPAGGKVVCLRYSNPQRHLIKNDKKIPRLDKLDSIIQLKDFSVRNNDCFDIGSLAALVAAGKTKQRSGIVDIGIQTLA